MLILIGLLFATTLAFGQDLTALTAERLEQVADIQRFSVEQGLAGVVVNDIVQDRQGYLWFATGNGLSRFDSYRFTTFHHDADASDSLADDRLKLLHLSASGTLWIAGQDGWLQRFNPQKETFETIANIITSPENGDFITTIADGPGQSLLLGTRQSGLLKLDTDSLRTEEVLPPDASDTPIRLLKMPDGHYWLASRSSIARLDMAKHKLVSLPHPAFGANLTDMTVESSGMIWLGTNGNGLFRYDPKQDDWQHIEYLAKKDERLGDNRIQRLLCDDNDNLWIGTFTAGVTVRFKQSGEYRHFSHNPDRSDSIGGNLTRSLYQDRDSMIWIGSYNGGVSKLNAPALRFGHFKRSADTPECLDNNAIYAILFDSDKGLWLSGYGGGLHRIDSLTGQCLHFTHNPFKPQSIGSNTVYALLEDNRGRVWIGTGNGGINWYDPDTKGFKTFSLADHRHPNRQGTIYSLYQDKRGRIWAGSLRSGLVSVDPDKGIVERYRHQADNDASIAGNTVNAIAEDDEGRLWIGTSQGLDRFESDGRFVHHLHDPADSNSLSSNSVYALQLDSKGFLWVGTESGLNRFDPKTSKTRRYGISDGLPSERIYGIVEDNAGELWFSTSKGLARYRPQSGRFERYDIQDGLQGNDFTNAAFHDPETDKLFFAGVNGFNAFVPADLPRHRPICAVTLTELLIDNRPISPGTMLDQDVGLENAINQTRLLVLDHNQLQIALEFSAMDNRAPMRNRYRYKLEGFDRQWLETDADHRRATYTNLDPGNYLFKVVAGNHKGEWYQSPTQLQLRILPPPWKTWWAYSLYIAAALLLIGLIYRIRTAALHRHARLLEAGINDRTAEIVEQKQTIESLLARKDAMFANISHEFRTPLTLILGRVEELMAEQQAPLSQNRLQTIRRNGQRLLRMVSQLLELTRVSSAGKVDLQPVRLAAVVDIISDGFATIAREKNLDFDVLSNGDGWLMTDIDALEQILLNLLSNAMKYTPPGGAVRLKTDCSHSSEVTIEVSDNGRGIPIHSQQLVFEKFSRLPPDRGQQPGSGIGLALVKELVTALKGHISLDSKPGEGSTFRVTLPAAEPPVAEVDTPRLSSLALELTTVEPDQTSAFDTPCQSTSETTALVIEDHIDMRRFLLDCLSDNYSTLTAQNGQEGIERALEHIPDIIVCDVMMPLKDGFEVVTALKRDERTCHIPIILLTAKGDDDGRRRGWQLLADEYLTKPFDRDELLLRMDNLLSIRQMLKQRFSHRLMLEEDNQRPDSPIHGLEPDKDQQFLTRLDEALALHYHNSETKIGQIARLMAMSERQLHRKLKALVGLTPSEYLRGYRLKVAARLLREGEPVGNVAFDVGIATHSHFTSCFKAQYGMTPTAYQEKNSDKRHADSNLII